MTHRFSTILGKSALLFLFPAAQYFALRSFLHFGLGLRFGFANTTDYDFLIPAPIAFLLLMASLPTLPRIRPNRGGMLINVLFLGLFLNWNLCHDTLTATHPTLFVSVWFALAIGVALSSFCILTSAQDLIAGVHPVAFLACLMVGSSLYIYQNGFRWVWNLWGFATAKVLHALFSVTHFLKIVSVYTPEEAVRIDHPLLSIRIARGCGGGDAFFYFTLAFVLGGLLYPHRARISRAVLMFLGGVGLMFALNLVRIVGLFAVGIWLRGHFEFEAATNAFKMLFHLQLGWLLYSVGIYSYLRWCAKHVREPDGDQSRAGLKHLKQLPTN